MKKLFILSITLILTFFVNNIFSQGFLEVKGKLALQEGGSAKEGTVKLYESGSFVQTVESDRSGKFKVDLDIGKDYIFEFSQTRYVTKKISINTVVPENYNDKSFTPIYFAVDLPREYEGVDLVVFSQPVGIIKFYEQIGDFDYDVDYSTEVRNKIAQAEKELEQAHKDHLEEQRQQEVE